MDPRFSHLELHERTAVNALLRALLRDDMPPLMAIALFGSKARGDHDVESDVDVLVVCNVPRRLRPRAAQAVHAAARTVARRHRVRLETWTVTAAELQRGRRTPMLVDALEDAVPLWPPPIRSLRLSFTPDDARFCVGRLLGWWRAGGPLVLRALARGQRARAAARVRDDITRLATAALLLVGDTRHRRRGTLRRFHQRFVQRGIVSRNVEGALRWASAAFPRHGTRGAAKPPPTERARASVEEGFALARQMEEELMPWILDRLD